MVIADADVWIDYFERSSSRTGQALDRLIRSGRTAVAEPVLAELVRGTQGDDELQELKEMLSGVPYVEMSRETWVRAGRIAHDLDRRGTRIPVVDIFIASLAIEEGHEVFTRDRHFERIPGLRLYKPKGASDA
ncbi:MAG: PIN domain-containing protein [Dehalococcoidia bacterium]|nr:PIN domain-containing protein [Dehalococcoidia bacterium]